MGDQLSGTLAMDRYSAEHVQKLESHYDIHSTTSPLEIKDDVGLPTTTCSQIAMWWEDEELVI